jgi:hypothetical protein
MVSPKWTMASQQKRTIDLTWYDNIVVKIPTLL